MSVETNPRQLSMKQALNEALRGEMRRDKRVIILGEDIAGGAEVEHLHGEEAWGGVDGVTRGLVKEFGRQRVLDTPISEAGFIGAAVGAAALGLRPVAELMFSGFVGVCLDPFLNQASKLKYMFGGKAKIPLVVRVTYGAGFNGAAQHDQVLYPIFVHIPGLKVVAPSTPYDAKGLLISSIRDDAPVVFFEHVTMVDFKGPVPEGEYTIPLGVADIKKNGRDVTVVAIGKMVHVALKAAEMLAEEGKDVEVVDPRTLQPLDEDTILNSVKKTTRLVIVDEANPRCSMASEIAAVVASKGFDYLDAPIRMVTAPHTPVPFSPSLVDEYIPSAEKVIQAVRETFM